MGLSGAHGVSPKAVALDGFHHQMIHTRGVRLHAVTAGDPKDPLVVLLHDSFGGWVDYRRVIEPLAARGFHVAALDMRGYGMSDKPPQGYDMRHACGDVAGAIRTLGHERAHVVGVGIGASVTWTLATSHPGHVLSIVTCGSIHPADMRKAVARAPWAFSNYVMIHTLMRTPSFFLTGLWRRLHPFLARDLRNTTSVEYQESEWFAEDLKLRETAMRIESTFPAVVRTTRLGLAKPPTKWAGNRVDVPVLMLVDGSYQSSILIKRADKRVRSLAPTTAKVYDARLRPHMESPEGFVDAVVDFFTPGNRHRHSR